MKSGDDSSLEAEVLALLAAHQVSASGSVAERVQAALQRLDPSVRQRIEKNHAFLRFLEGAWSEAAGAPDAPSSPDHLEALRESSSAPRMLPRISGYEIVEELGRGGMGVVYKAMQHEPHRLVALKMISPGALAGPELLARFRREIETSASLEHPDIVRLYGSGQHDSGPYFVLEYVDGGSLTEALKTCKPSVAEAMALVERLARAMQYAHERGIIHRDLKPGNVLLASTVWASADSASADSRSSVSSRGETPGVRSGPGGMPPHPNPLPKGEKEASGLGLTGRRLADFAPKIADFGLAKVLQDGVTLTHSTHCIGTPSYMAPEQAAGNHDALTVRVDIYALGAILYEMLAGRPPFAGSSALQILEKVRSEPVVSPRQVNSAVSRDLETICLKCLAKDPNDRYRTAAALAEDLRRLQVGDPILARPAGKLETVLKWSRRHPARSALVVLTCLLVVGLPAAAMWLVSERAATRLAADQAADHRYYHCLTMADRSWLASQLKQAEFFLDQCPHEKRHWEWNYLKQRCGGERLVLGHAAADLQFTPDGATLVTCGPGQPIRLWDSKTVQELCVFPQAKATRIAIAPDSKTLAGILEDTVHLWRISDGTHLARLPHIERVVSVHYSPDGKWLATLTAAHAVQLWDAQTGKVAQELNRPGSFLNHGYLAFSRDGHQLAFCDGDAQQEEIKIWDFEQQRIVEKHVQPGQFCGGLAFGTDGCLAIAWTGKDNRTARLPEIQVWRGSPRSLLHTLRGHSNVITGIAFDVDGTRLASTSVDATARVWDAESGKLLGLWRSYPASQVAFHPGGDLLAVRYPDCIRFWGISAEQGTRLFPHLTSVNHLAFAPDGSKLAASFADGTVEVVDLANGQAIFKGRHAGPFRGALGIAFGPRGTCVATASRGPEVYVWNVATGTIVRRLPHAKAEFVLCTGDRLVAAGQDGFARIWDIEAGVAVQSFPCGRPVSSLAVDRDGRFLAVGMEGTVKVWDGTSAALLRQWDVFGDWSALAFHPQGRLLAGASTEKVIWLWNLDTGLVERKLEGHTYKVTALVFSRDGKRLFSASDDKSIKVWDVTTGMEALTLTDHQLGVNALALSADGSELASAGWDGTIRVRRGFTSSTPGLAIGDQ